MLLTPANYIHIDGITEWDSVAMNNQYKFVPLPSDRAVPDHKFKWSSAIFAFMIGVVISGVILGVMIALTSDQMSSDVEPPGWIVGGWLIGFIVAVVLPFILGAWYGKVDQATD